MKIDPTAVETAIREVVAEHILPRYQTLRTEDISEKNGPRDLVTVADVAAEKALTPRLMGILPGSQIVGEESYAADATILSLIRNGEPTWIIDPIDGTWSFIHGEKCFGVIVALVDKGETVAGWLHHALTGESMTVERGSGTWFRGKKLRALPARPLHEMVGTVGLGVGKWLKQLPADERSTLGTILKPRPACHNYVRLLTDEPLFGQEEPQAHYRVLPVNSKPWDDAAGQLAYIEAGGYATNWHGEAYKPHMIGQGAITAPDRDSWDIVQPYYSNLQKRFSGS